MLSPSTQQGSAGGGAPEMTRVIKARPTFMVSDLDRSVDFYENVHRMRARVTWDESSGTSIRAPRHRYG